MATTTKQRVTLFMLPAIAKQARAQAVLQETTLSALVEEALIAFLPTETVIKKAQITVDSDPHPADPTN